MPSIHEKQDVALSGPGRGFHFLAATSVLYGSIHTGADSDDGDEGYVEIADGDRANACIDHTTVDDNARKLPINLEDLLRWSLPTYWNLVEQISELTNEKTMLLNECSKLRSHGHALWSDSQKLRKTLHMQEQALHEAKWCILDYKMRLARKAADATCDEDSGMSPPSTGASDGQQPPEDISEVSKEESSRVRVPKAFLTKNELVDVSHGDPWPSIELVIPSCPGS
ncbi:unnamed protein product [Symbiodinium sp. CCMP2592]|nr:unnamed protein product [Symbiodinium sp. CCMP2592]